VLVVPPIPTHIMEPRPADEEKEEEEEEKVEVTDPLEADAGNVVMVEDPAMRTVPSGARE
jgi:hypothetical protein